jgi:hypothetical protein
VQRLHPDRQNEFVAILNAIESHVEEGQGDPAVLRHLAGGLLAMTAVVHLDGRVVTAITAKLDKLHDRIRRLRVESLSRR